MLQGSTILGIGFILFGLVFFLLVWVLLRTVPHLRPEAQNLSKPVGMEIQFHDDAIIVVESGGRIRSINPETRSLFDMANGEYPNLERLGRKVRPAAKFLEICAAEGQSRVSINGKQVDAISYRVPGDMPVILVALRLSKNELPQLESASDNLPVSTLKSISEFGQSIASSLSLPATMEAILINVERLVASDFVEVKYWDEATRSLVPYRMEGTSETERTLQREKASLFKEYAQSLVSSRKELVIADTRISESEKYDPINHSVPPMGSYIGIPLLAYEQLVGTLEVGVVPVKGFSPDDVHILQLVSGQAAVALRNAGLYEAQQRWNSQLFGLTNLSQAIGSLRDLKDLFARMVDGLSPLFNVEILGFLLFDEERHTLEAQMPFQGLPNNVVQIYKSSIRANGLAEKRILAQEIISTVNAAQDAAWADLGLQDLAQAAAIRDAALIPLVSATRFLGYLQLSNHLSGEPPISQEELRLLNIVASQVAAIIDNALLVQQARQRNQRTEAMRRIASLVCSSATLDETLQYSLRDVAQLLQAESGSIFLMDESDGVMRAHIPSVYGVSGELYNQLSRMNVKSSAYRMTVAGSQRPFLSGNLVRDRRVMPLYRAIVRVLGLESAVVVPLVVRGKGIGEMMLGTKKPDFFTNYDLQIASTVASQLAIAIDNARYLGETDVILRRRSDYLTAINRIARELNSSTNFKELGNLIYEESLAVSGAECGSVVIFEPEAVADEPRVAIHHLGHAYADMFLDAANTEHKCGEPRLLTEFEATKPPHSGVREVLIVPICHHDENLGVIELHKSSSDGGFDETCMEMVKNIGVQSALALSNAHRYIDQQNRIESFRRRADTLMQLFETAKNLRIDETLISSMDSIAQGIQKSTPFNVVLISLFDAKTGMLSRVVSTGLDEEAFAQAQAHQTSWGDVTQLMKSEFEIGNLYFIPFDQAPIIPADLHMLTIMTEAEKKPNAWDPDDLLFIPIYDNDESPLGLISVDAPRNGLRPDRIALETMEVFAAQAALTITSGLRIQTYKSQIDNLNREVNRQQSLVVFSQRSLPMMLHKDLEQSISIGNLAQRAHHIRASLQLTEAIGRQLDSFTALQMIGQQVLTSFDMSIAIVARETIDGPQITQTVGNLPRGVNPEASFGQRNPLRVCLQTGETIISDNLEEDEIWHDTPFLTNLRAKSFICMPIVINNKPVAAVLATDTESMPVLTSEDRLAYSQISKQVSIILQNLNLLNETRQRLQEVNLLLDFSRHLSGLNSRDILKSLLESALRVVTPAHAGVVFVWEQHEELLKPLAAANYADDASLMGISYRFNEGLPGRVFAEKQPARIDEVNFALDYNLSADNLLKYRKATGGRLPVSSLLLPIFASESFQGLLVLDNLNTQAAFQAEDEALLLSLIQQVALSLENLRLMQSTQERAGQLQALNAVAATLTTSLQREELVDSLLDRMSTVIPFDTAILWLRQENKMVVAQARGFDDNEKRQGLTVDVADSVLLNEMTRTGQAIVVDDVRLDLRFSRLVQQRYLAWMGIPLITKDKVMGVIAIDKLDPYFYTNELMQLATTFASQAAVAIDNANLFEESLRRAAELDERSQRLAMLNTFSAELGGSLSADQVLRLTANQLMNIVHADRAMLLLLEKSQRTFLLNVLPEKPGAAPMARSLLPESAAFARLRETQSVYIAEDIGVNPALASLRELFQDAQSLLIMPMPSADNLYAIALQTQTEHRFTATEIELSRTICNQASIALENSDLYQSTLATAERLAILNQVSFEIGANLNPEDIYTAIHQAAGRLMPLDAMIIALLDEDAAEVDAVYVMDMGQRINGVRFPVGEGLVGKVIKSGQPILTLQPAEADERRAVTIGEIGITHSIAVVPLVFGSKVIGAISVQSYQFDAYTEYDQQILSTLANQATVAILNARLLDETQKLAATLEQRVVKRTAELEHEKHNTETLLRILTEVSASLDLDRALSRTLALLNDAIGAEQGTIMLLQAEDNMLHYRAGYGYLSETGQNMPPLKVGEGLTGWVVKNRQPVMVPDLYQDSRWLVTQGSQQHRSALVAPLMVGEDVLGAIMVYHREINFFSSDTLDMVKAIGAQVAIAINNAQLYELIRDQAERLGSLLRQQQMEASRQTAILEAVADGVLVTDSANMITFVNASAENILSVTQSQMKGQSLENFAGLFGRSTQTWVKTVKDWSENPGNNLPGDMYAEQISLDNGRVALVHLAPVVWRNEFLGTVSIFRDITHEVEVDRLKSEFVATVSHELRTPMTSIRGYVDVMLMGAAGALNENQTHFLDIVKSNTERLNILVNDLLDVSRLEAGRVTLSMHPVDLQEVADEVVSDIQRRSQEENKPMEVCLEVSDNPLPRVMADPDRIKQVLGLLVDNAYNYTPAEGSIKISLHKENGSVQVDVRDSGIGVSLEHRERVFERFYRGEDPLVLATPGTGLGLPIVKQLIEMHHGKIWMDSTGIVGQGSTFSFTLPVSLTEE